MSILNSPLTIPTLDLQKLIGADGTLQQQHTFLPQFQPQVLFSIPSNNNNATNNTGGQQLTQIQPLVNTTSLNGATVVMEKVSSGEKAADSSAEKSPLQLVQDVVNRVDEKKKKDGEGTTEADPSKSDSTSDTKSDDGASNNDDNDDGDKSKKTGGEVVSPVNDSSSLEKSSTNPSDKAAGGGEESPSTEKSTSDGTPTAKSATDKILPKQPDSVTTQLPPQQQHQFIQQIPQTVTVSSTPQIFLQQSGGQPTFTTSSIPTSDAFGQMRYPIIQTIQPFFSTGGQLIFSSPNQAQQGQGNTTGDPSSILQQGQQQHQPSIQQQPQQQSFIYHHQDAHQAHQPFSAILGDGTTMPFMFDPAAGTFISPLTLQSNNNATTPGGKKKKKRLSKKQQQQQAHLQLQQQLLIQQIQAQQQAQQALSAAFSSPLTIFPQSFPLSLQPMGMNMNMNMNMPFFQPQTILTLPNLILNPADGTLFLQPSAPVATQQQATTLGQQQQQQGNVQLQQGQLIGGGLNRSSLPTNPLIAPKKDETGSSSLSKPGSESGSSDDLRRNNPTPDSSTGDIGAAGGVTQLGILAGCGGSSGSNSSSTTTTPIPSPIISVGGGGGNGGGGLIPLGPGHQTTTTTTVLPVVKKASISKSRAVSSSSTVKRIFHQKQILPKIDSTTPSND